MTEQIPPRYLDYAATTPVDERVLTAMLPFFTRYFGNTSSIHQIGQLAENALENARQTISDGLNCTPEEIIFTSCGSESDNLALRGTAFARRNRFSCDHILISPVEHPAVLRTAQQLARQHGFEVEYLPVDQNGFVDPREVERRIRRSTALVSVILANNEIGTINEVAEIGSICREREIPFHTDAVQAVCYLPIDVQQMNLDLVSIGAHKFYGPKGVGALYVRKGTRILPVLTGGGQEFGLRAGTHNVPLIVGMAKAFELAQTEREQRVSHVTPLRDRIIAQVLETISDSQLTGHNTARLPNHASFVFRNVDGNSLLMLLDVEGFSCSSGSACKTGDPEPSEVLLALGLERSWALGSLRVTLGTGTKPAEVETFLQFLPQAVDRARTL